MLPQVKIPFWLSLFPSMAFLLVPCLDGATLTVTSSNGTYSPVSRSNVQLAFNAAVCGDEIQIEAGSIARTGADVLTATISGTRLTATTPYDHNLPVGQYVRFTGLTGAAAALNRSNFLVIEVPAANTIVLNMVGFASGLYDGTYTNQGITVYSDRFVISYDPAKKNCSEGNEITITTTKKDWLPDADMRITPSYKPLLVTLQLVGDSNNNSLLLVEDKVAGLKFIGVGFQKIGILPYTLYSFLEVTSSEITTGESMLPQRISIDRSLFYNDHQLGNSWKNTLNLRVKNFTFVNNFVDDMMGRPLDSETYVSNLGPSIGPFKIRNNYVCCAIGMPFIFGARNADYATGYPNFSDILVEHNSFYTSPKHYPTSPTYVGDAYFGIVKNCSEMKSGLNAVFRWNTCENQFSGGGSQWYGFTFSARGFSLPGAGTCSLDGTRTVLTCPQLNYYNPLAGQIIGLDTGSTVVGAKYQWRTLVSADKATQRYTMSAPYGGEVGSTNLIYVYVANPWYKVDNVLVYGNYFKNVAAAIQVLGEDSLYPVRTENIAMKNNLMVYDSPYFKIAPGQDFFKSPFYICCHGRNYQFSNNTTYENPNWKSGIIYARAFRLDSDYGLPIENLRFTNNLLPFDYVGGGAGQVKALVAADLVRNVSFRNNTFVGSGGAIEPCAPSDCRGNFVNGVYAPQFRNPEKNDFSLVPGSNYTNAGTDGSDLGVDIEEVAIIRELTVKPDAHSMLFSWRVPSFMKSMGCQLEVSENSSLTTDVGGYEVVNALRPDYFIRSDSDRSNKRATKSDDGMFRWFQVGQDVQETDDNGQVRNLTLNPDTEYHYRLMCGGATERGSVRTLKLPSDTVNRQNVEVEIKVKASRGTQVRPRAGFSKNTIAAVSAQSCTTGCTIRLSGLVGSQLIYYLDELDQSGNVVFQSTRPTVLMIH